MTQSMVTVAAPIKVEDLARALSFIQALGNPAGAGVAEALGRLDGEEGVHFASLHAIPPTDEASPTGHIVLEFSADGTEGVALARLVDRIGERLTPVFALASDWKGEALLTYLTARKLALGVGWTGRTGLAFCGAPGMSVGRIRREAELAKALTAKLEVQGGGMGALDRLDAIRAGVRADPALAWALTTPAPLPVAPNPTTLGLISAVAASFVLTYLWPCAALYGLLLAVRFIHELGPLGTLLQEPHRGEHLIRATWSGLLWSLGLLVAILIPVLIAAVGLYLSLRAKEDSDWLDERAPERAVLHEILAHENHCAQNHMVSVTRRKPGLTRRITSRLAFWIIGTLAGLQFQPGHLGNIGTIHFARWVMLPGSKDFVFFSNFGGSWESYLEDFITKAHEGLTAVWSNTVGFPRTQNLFQAGATDGERFKRYARRSMLPTPFWFSAYPAITTDNIRSNAAIRSGLAAAMTDAEATAWLALFGSAQRPVSKLESDQIQSLVFGGLGFMPFGKVLLMQLDGDAAGAGAWLKALLPDVAFDDGRRLDPARQAVLTLALGPGALAKAGLPADAIETFPAAYLDGMTGPGRDRILGDDPEDPWWWDRGRTMDAAVLVYGKSQAAVDALADRVLAPAGAALVHAIPLNDVPKTPHEPFGFLDGVSQPVIRSTYRSFRNPDPIHIVEPGEFILGYPDNRGNLPPGPTMDAMADPANRLPIRCTPDPTFAGNLVNAPREIARNGSFLVIRQLEQDVDGFWAYCTAQSERLQGRLPDPYDITPEFIGAKLVGRWKDGRSLARNPYQPGDTREGALTNLKQRPTSNPARGAAIAASPGPAVDRHGADNDFLLGAEDPQGLRCPYGAHIRRANPRDSLDPGAQDQIDISNRHRIIRVGRAYAPQAGQKPGLLFMCLNGDIERQFEFVQQTWLGSETFHGLSGERDPLAGNRSGCPNGFTMPTREGPVRLEPLARFVTARGGGYFFLPGKALLEFLANA